MDTIEFRGKQYPTRTFTMTSDETGAMTVTIADESLIKAIRIIGGEEFEKTGVLKLDAEEVDNKIYFYVEEGILSLSAEEICKNHLDEEFEFICEGEEDED